ncbi:unnamed protein product, partial [Didymodactylos carnosus]
MYGYGYLYQDACSQQQLQKSIGGMYQTPDVLRPGTIITLDGRWMSVGTTSNGSLSSDCDINNMTICHMDNST